MKKMRYSQDIREKAFQPVNPTPLANSAEGSEVHINCKSSHGTAICLPLVFGKLYRRAYARVA